LEAREEFKESERLRVDMYPNYTYYGSIGFRLLFMPASQLVFFSNSTLVSGLTSHIDSSDVLSVYNPFIGRNLFSEKPGNYKDFSGIILLLASLLAISLGYDSFKKLEYIKFLSSISSAKIIYLSIIVSRAILISLFFIITTGLSLVLVWLNRLRFQREAYVFIFSFLLVIIAVILFFYAFGTALGTIKSKSVGFMACVATWFFFIFLVPGIINSYIHYKAGPIASNYKVGLEKLQLSQDFENRARAAEGKFDISRRNTTAERNLIESYWENEFMRIQEVEEGLERDMMNHLRLYQKLSILSPSSFYLSAAGEVSGAGYENIVDFCKYSRQVKWRFTRFYLDRKFYGLSDPPGQPENFIKANENIYNASGRLPAYFEFGIALTLLYTLLLFGFSFYRFKRSMFALSRKEVEALEGTEVAFRKGEFSVWKINGKLFTNLLYSLFSRENKGLASHGFDGKVLLDDQDIAVQKYSGDFIYICPSTAIPGDIKVADFLSLIRGLMSISAKKVKTLFKRLNIDMASICGKKFSQLGDLQRSEILLALTRLKKYPVYLINDIAEGLPNIFAVRLTEGMEALKNEGGTVIYLTSSYLNIKKVETPEQGFFEDTSWHFDIMLVKRRLKIGVGEKDIRQ
jgi:ABC-type transport system involved in multi-copper enzyme maturation permease subunit